MSLLNDLQRSIISALRSDTVLRGLLATPNGVYERVPPNRMFPCIVVEQSTVSDWSTDHEPGRDVIVSLGIWSRTNNRAEMYAVSDRTVSVLEARIETPENLQIVLTTLVSATYERDAFQRAYRGTLRMRFLIEPTS